MDPRISQSAKLLIWLSDRFPEANRSRFADEEAYVRWQFSAAQWLWPRVVSKCLDLQGKKVVDLGCGPGGKTMFYSTLSPAHIIGIDCAEAKIASAQRFLTSTARRRSNCEFRLGRAEATGLEAGQHDIVISEDGFEHFSDLEGILREAHRILCDGGLFLIMFAPYWGPDGPHLYNFIRLPYAHYFFSWSTMSQATRAIAARMERHGTPQTQSPALGLQIEQELTQLEQVSFGLRHLRTFFDWRALERAARAGTTGTRATDDASFATATPTQQAEREIAQLEHFINKISLRRFKRLLKLQIGWELVGFHRYVYQRRRAAFVITRNMWPIDEIYGSLVFLLRKAAGKRIRASDFRSLQTRMSIGRVLE